MNEKEARDKVGQALRDAIKIIRSSSRKAKSGTAGLKDSNTTSSSIESTLRSRDISRKRSISSIDSEKLDVSGTASQNGNTVCGIQLEKVEGNTSYAMVPGNLENQAQGVGSQPSIKQNRLDDFERHTMSKMLESSIEPLETSNVHERNFPSADSCMFANAFASKRLDTPCDFLQDSHTQSQLSRQLTSNHGIAENVERRIPKQDQSSEWQLRMNDPFGSALFLPVIGADTSLVSPPQCDQNARQSAHKRHTAAGPWDLEPTPLNVPPARRENSNDQRAAALARLLFHEESYL